MYWKKGKKTLDLLNMMSNKYFFFLEIYPEDTVEPHGKPCPYLIKTFCYTLF